MRGMKHLLAATGLCLAALAPGAGAETLTVQWLPGESYVGGKQYDARLDRPVKLWGAGMPVKKAFAEISAQTGVKLACLPPGEDNERICLNVYLNPKSPPNLRAVMTQLSWVLDCAFGYTGEGKARAYYLLSTSMKEGAVERITQARGDRAARAAQARREQYQRTLAQVPTRWEEFKATLALSREELIRRYQGKDDALLLAMLDPGRRALVEYLAARPDGELEHVLSGNPTFRQWSTLLPAEQERLRRLFASNLENMRDVDPETADRVASRDWGNEGGVKVGIASEHGLLAMVAYEGEADVLPSDPESIVGGAAVTLVPPLETGMMVADRMSLRRALGETVTAEDREALIAAEDEASAKWQEAAEAQQMKELLRARVQLSEKARQALSKVPLPVGEEEGHALWQLQELVAAATSWHVISDCFLQPERSVTAARAAFCREDGGEANALKALCLVCAAPTDEGPLLHRMGPRYREDEPPALTSPGAAVGWEWGDAGQFLRFRSAERDLWRLSFVPADLLEQVDRWTEQLRTQECKSPCGGRTVEVAMPLPEAARVAARLSEYQGRLGGRIAYADPSDPKEACRQAIRAEALDELARGNQLGLGALATLNDEQWERIQGKGIAVAELSPLPQPSAMGRALSRLVSPEDFPKLVLRITTEDWASRDGSRDTHLIDAFLGEKGVFSGLLLARLQVQVRPLKSPVEAPEEGEQ